MPQLVPAEDPELLGTAFGLLTNELARSPEATIDAVLRLLEQARSGRVISWFFFDWLRYMLLMVIVQEY